MNTTKLMSYVPLSLICLTFASAQAADSLPYYSDHCPTGDPICVAATTPLAHPAISKTLTAQPKSEKKLKSAAQAYAGHETLQARAVKPDSADSSNIQQKHDSQGNWSYTFSADGVNGNIDTEVAKIRGFIHPKTAVPCLDIYLDANRQDTASPDSLRQAYSEFLRCTDSCLSVNDALFLASCPDWQRIFSDRTATNDVYEFMSGKVQSPFSQHCSEKQILAGRNSQAFTNTGRNETTGRCRFLIPQATAYKCTTSPGSYSRSDAKAFCDKDAMNLCLQHHGSCRLDRSFEMNAVDDPSIEWRSIAISTDEAPLLSE